MTTKEQLKHIIFHAKSKEQIGSDIDEIIADLISTTSNFSHLKTIMEECADYVEELKEKLVLEQNVDKKQAKVAPFLMHKDEEDWFKSTYESTNVQNYRFEWIDFLLFAQCYLKNWILNLDKDFEKAEIQKEESEEMKGLKDEVANLRKDIATKYDFNKQVFKREEAIAYLGVSERQFTTLVSTKKLIKPVSRAQKSYTFLKAELDKYLESSAND